MGGHVLKQFLLLTLETLKLGKLLFASGEHHVIGGGLRGGEEEPMGRGGAGTQLRCANGAHCHGTGRLGRHSIELGIQLMIG